MYTIWRSIMTCTLCWQCTIQFRLFRLKLSFRTLYDFDSNETIDIYYFMYCRLEFLYLIIHDCELFDRLQKIWYRSTHSCMCKYLDWWLFWSKNLDVTGSAEQFSKSGGGGVDPPILKCRGSGGVGCGVVDFKNGLPGVDSISFNTITTHQSFF